MDAFDAAMTEQRERARKSANRDAWGTSYLRCNFDDETALP